MSTTDIKIDVVFTSECIKHFSVLKAQGFNLKGNEKGLIGYIIKQILHVHFFLISDLSAPGNICLLLLIFDIILLLILLYINICVFLPARLETCGISSDQRKSEIESSGRMVFWEYLSVKSLFFKQPSEQENSVPWKG